MGVDIAGGLPQNPAVDADLGGFAPLAFSLELVAFPSLVMASLEPECIGVHPVSLIEATKPVKCYNRRTKDSRFSKMDDSLIAEAMMMFTPKVLPTIVFPEPFVKLEANVKAVVRKSPPARGFLWRGFLRPSSSAVSVDP